MSETRRNATSLRWRLMLLLIAASAFAAGCGPKRPPLISVRGRVLLDGKAPTKPGMVYFAPIDPAPGLPRHPGRGEFDADGNFRAMTFDPADGLLPGRYKVGLDCWTSPPKPIGPPPESLIPPSYREPGTSPLELTVDPKSKPMTVEFNVPR
jgi:hypothetical protein